MDAVILRCPRRFDIAQAPAYRARASKEDGGGRVRLHAAVCRPIVDCATGDDLSNRVEDHKAGKYPGYTFSRRPVELVWSQYFDRVTDANAAERQIKGWGRAKKEALIKSEWKTISALARRRGGKDKP
jgi:putative endonuclease